MKKTKILGLLASAAICTFAYTAPSQAATIDFTSSDWSGANGTTSYSVGSVTLSSTGGSLTQGSEGIGVDGPLPGEDPGEIGFLLSTSETVTVDFGGLVNVGTVYLSNLFANEFFSYDERAVINGVTYQATSVSGMLAISLNAAFESLTFSAPSDLWISDYSLSSIEVSAVPLPAAAYLFGSGLLGLFGVRRRVAKKAA